MTIFDYLKDIVVTKKGDLILDQYVPYMVNRWLSFINPTVLSCINQVNKSVLLENKELHYKTMLAIFPKMKYIPRISYVKKIKEEKEGEEDNRLQALAQQLEISKREASELLSDC